MNNPSQLWAELASAAGLVLSPDQERRLAAYLDLLIAANETMNLTRLTDRPAAEILHVGDALTLLPYLPKGPITIADVGSGGGCPGIPLAIVRPEAKIICIESTQKKAKFLQTTAAALELANVEVIAQRAEDVGHGPKRERCDVAVARALGTLVWVAEFCLPLVKRGGKLLAMKGPKVAGELAGAAVALRKLGGGKPVIHPVKLPGTDGHVIAEIAKVKATDRRYPRLPTQAKGNPL